MMKILFKYCWLLLLFVFSCGHRHDASGRKEDLTPKVQDNGNRIVFPNAANVAFFETETIGTSQLNAQINAPAKVAATVIRSDEGASQNIILFDNSDLAGNYTQLVQHLININQIQNVNIRQKKTELDRTKDLQSHGAATGRELLEAQTALAMEETNLANERAAIIEHETKLKAAGFLPELLRKADAGTAYIICDIPESEVERIEIGSICNLKFTAFPNENFAGKVDDVADMVDQSTRMVKLRIMLNNSSGKLKAGMFATVSFRLNEGNRISVSKNAVVTIQARNYVFEKINANTFERRPITTGDQIGDRIIVHTGLKGGEQIAIKGVMQLKGLSFGY